MNAPDPRVSPDLVIAGAARSGTSFLGATLARHPDLDGGQVKEPDYFSSNWDRGPDWYDRLYAPRHAGSRRMDASVSYTYPQHPLALTRVHEANPTVQVVLTVREPLARLVSHYQLFRYYYSREDIWPDLTTAIDTSVMFLGAGDYGHWLQRLTETFPIDNVLVVPFPVLTDRIDSAVQVVLDRLQLDAPDGSLAAPAFRNEARAFRSPAVRAAHRFVHRSGLYPRLRRLAGPDRLRRLRGSVTREVTMPGVEDELATLSPAQRTRVDDHAAAASAAVDDFLLAQDERLGLDWAPAWRRGMRSGGVTS